MYRLVIKVFLNTNTLAQGKRVLERDLVIPKDVDINYPEIIRTMLLLYGEKAVISFNIFTI